MEHDQQEKCPVCAMEVMRHQNEIVYQKMHFAFCSDQCKARFLAHPHLYIGFPGRTAPKQEGQVVFKRRRIRLQQPLSVEGEALIGEQLRRLMGVTSVTVTGDAIEIVYDLLQVSLGELEVVLTEAGARLGGGWAEVLSRALSHESEELEISAREVDPPHHYLP